MRRRNTSLQICILIRYFLFNTSKLGLANKTHLYAVPATNLFYLEGPSDRIEPRDLGINLPGVVHRGTNSAKYRTFFNRSVYIGQRSRSIYHRMPCYQSPAPIEPFNTSEMSAVSTSIGRLSETTRAKENTWGYLDRWQSIYHETASPPMTRTAHSYRQNS